jgi:hypothetical protein
LFVSEVRRSIAPRVEAISRTQRAKCTKPAGAHHTAEGVVTLAPTVVPRERESESPA